jgi:hypothetical protein
MDSTSVTDPLEVPLLWRLREGAGRLRIQVPVPSSVSMHQLLTEGLPGRVRGRVLAKGPMSDLVGTYWGIVYLVSEKMVTVLSESGMTGWRVTPVEIADGQPIRRLSLLTVTGRCGPIYGQSGVWREGLPQLGQFLEPESWDGSDLFVPDNENGILLTPRCASVLRRARLRNLRLTPAGIERVPGASKL